MPRFFMRLYAIFAELHTPRPPSPWTPARITTKPFASYLSLPFMKRFAMRFISFYISHSPRTRLMVSHHVSFANHRSRHLRASRASFDHKPHLYADDTTTPLLSPSLCTTHTHNTSRVCLSGERQEREQKKTRV